MNTLSGLESKRDYSYAPKNYIASKKGHGCLGKRLCAAGRHMQRDSNAEGEKRSEVNMVASGARGVDHSTCCRQLTRLRAGAWASHPTAAAAAATRRKQLTRTWTVTAPTPKRQRHRSSGAWARWRQIRRSASQTVGRLSRLGCDVPWATWDGAAPGSLIEGWAICGASDRSLSWRWGQRAGIVRTGSRHDGALKHST